MKHNKPKYDTGVYRYLKSCGVLEQPPEVIQAAKRVYWNMRKRELKKAKQKREHAFTVSYTASEHRRIADAAAMHGMSRTKFVRLAALAYVDMKYLVPNIEALQQIKTLLSLNYSALLNLSDNDVLPHQLGGELLYKLEQLEHDVLKILLQPKRESNDY